MKDVKWLRLLLAYLLIGVLSACSQVPPDDGGDPGGGDRPVISSLTASPPSITPGGSSTLSWSVSGATSLRLDPGSIDVTGTTSRVVSPTATTEYTLTATNAEGSTTRRVTVTVSGDQPGQTYSRSGFVGLSEVDTGGSALRSLQAGSLISGSGVFYALDTPLPVPENADPYVDLADSCFVYAEGDPVPVPDPDPTDPLEITYLDAGEAITVESGTGTYAIMSRLMFDSTISYATDTSPLAPLPDAGLTVNIPGAPGAGGFPAFAEVALPDVAAFDLTSPADTSSIDQNTTFAWSGGSSTTLVMLSGMGQDLIGTNVSFFCIASDDGSFSFPAETIADLTARGFTTGMLLSAGRQGYALHQQDDAVLFLSVSRSESYGVIVPAGLGHDDASVNHR